MIPDGGADMSSNTARVGDEMYGLVERLYPIFRSITGAGVRETLSVLSEYIPLDIHEVPTGTRVLDWDVPKEWIFRDAYVKDDRGRRVIDVATSNLHVVNYSTGVHETMVWSDLREHVYSLPEHAEWIPYRTTYFDETWGFCVSHRQFLELEALGERQYEVCIDASHRDGSLTYGECLIRGETDDEVLITAHVCHPSLANDNLSGIAVATYLARHIAGCAPRYSYRFVFAPATIGAITWLSMNEHRLDRVKHGLVLSLLGDAGSFTYKTSRRVDAEIDRAVSHVLGHSEPNYEIREFSPIGYDERQYCSPGFDLPVGCLMRTPNGEFPEYHTSADDLTLVTPLQLARAWDTCTRVMQVLDANQTFVNQKPRGEPRLGPLGLYARYGSPASQRRSQQAVLWTLNLSDGEHSLLDVAERSGLPFEVVRGAATLLYRHSLLEPTATTDDGKQDTQRDLAERRQSLRRLG